MTQRIMAGGVVKLDNVSAALADISQYVRQVTLDPQITRTGFYTLSSRDEQQPVGAVPRAQRITLECIKTDDAAGPYAIVSAWYAGTDVLKTIELYDPDTAVGSDKWTGEVALMNPGQLMTKQADSGEIEVFTVELAASGGLTQSTVAAT